MRSSTSTACSLSQLSIVPEDVLKPTVLDVLLIGPASLRVLGHLSPISPQLVYRPANERQDGAVMKLRAVPSDSKGMPCYRSKTDAENAIAVFVLDLGTDEDPAFPSVADQLEVLRILAFLFKRPERGQHRARLAFILLLGDCEPPAEVADFASGVDGAKQCFATGLEGIERALLGIAGDRMGRRASLSSSWSGLAPELAAGLHQGSRRAPRARRGKREWGWIWRIVPWRRRSRSCSRQDVDASAGAGAAARTAEAAQAEVDPTGPGAADAKAAGAAEEEPAISEASDEADCILAI